MWRVLAAGISMMVLAACGSDPDRKPTEPLDEHADHSASAAPTKAGRLDQSAMPRPSAFGPGWDWYVESGSVDDAGFVANGEPVHGHDAARLASEILPIGCATPRPSVQMPTPRSALVADYAKGGARAYAFALDFATAAAAKRYLAGFATVEKACGSSVNALTSTSNVRFTDEVLTAVRTTSGLKLNERMVREGRVVRLVSSPEPLP